MYFKADETKIIFKEKQTIRKYIKMAVTSMFRDDSEWLLCVP